MNIWDVEAAADFHLCCRPRANDAPCQIKACKSQEDSARADPFHPRPRHTLISSSRLNQLKWLALHFSLPLCNPTDVTSALCTRARSRREDDTGDTERGDSSHRIATLSRAARRKARHLHTCVTNERW